MVTSLQRVSLGPGCSEVLLYTTLLGGIGALLPFTSRQDLEFCQALEMHLRQEAPPLCGRDLAGKCGLAKAHLWRPAR